ncbi:DNA polymerase III subunit gamma/tau [Mycoplasmopsis iners]|uniref:DNA polymerase III subunit gamma/tau n=1 Tax=Mycoplasmopsis iners TaxID=76630 RepID=UPI0004975A48|nr:DNA polymerase III subunit gamma/tau [Mycoplasmopsis iners]
MAYKALYRKYRPQKFIDVRGQDHIVQTLQNIINSNKISHAYLFSGPRGVGKTSVAKIFAAALNCIHTADPSDICENCLNSLGNNLDIIEMDGASNNGVDEVRKLQEKIEHLPTNGRFKIYIIDEVHMLTKVAFNAILKTLEEPPAHVIFIFATTDPQKIPPTILSRLQRHNFKKITNKTLVNQVEKVLNLENIQYEPEAIPYIARLAQGGMRDALSIVEQSIAYGNDQVKLKDIIDAFGVIANEKIIGIINNLFLNKQKMVLKEFDELKNNGIDANEFVNSMLNILKEFLIFQRTNEIDILEYLNLADLQQMQINEQFAFETIEQLYKLHKELRYDTNPFVLIEVYLLKMLNKNAPASKPETLTNSPIKKPISQNSINESNEFSTVENAQTNQTNIVPEEHNVEQILEQTAEFVIKQQDAQENLEQIEKQVLSNNKEIVSDNLLSTEEINLDNNLSSNTFEFNLTNNLEDNKFQNYLSFEELKNILRHNTSEANKINEVWKLFDFYKTISPDKDVKKILQILASNYLKIIGYSDNHILIYGNSRSDAKDLNYLKNNCYNSNIQEFFKQFLGDYKHIFIINHELKNTLVKVKEKLVEESEQANGNLTEVVPFGEVPIKKVKSPTQQLYEKLIG